MGWWQTYDGTVIGDELADDVGRWLDKLAAVLVSKYSGITKDQILHTISFCSAFIRPFDRDGEEGYIEGKMLYVLPKGVADYLKDVTSGIHTPSEEVVVAPGTRLTNVRNPFTGDIN